MTDIAELQEEFDLIVRLGELLTGVANALKGEPEPNTWHDWSDLPKVAARCRAQLNDVQALISYARKVSPGEISVYVADLERIFGADVVTPHKLGFSDAL